MDLLKMHKEKSHAYTKEMAFDGMQWSFDLS